MLSGLECEYRQACLSRRDHPRSRFRCYGRCSGGRERPPRFRDGMSSQDQLLEALHKEGFKITQATLSRDLKLLKVAKAASSSGKYAYVLPNDTLYKRVSNHIPVSKMMVNTGFQSINFSGNMVVIKTRPGYASSIAYNIDNSDISQILGTIAGDDTIFLVKKKGTTEEEIINALAEVIPDVHHKYV